MLTLHVVHVHTGARRQGQARTGTAGSGSTVLQHRARTHITEDGVTQVHTQVNECAEETRAQRSEQTQVTVPPSLTGQSSRRVRQQGDPWRLGAHTCPWWCRPCPLLHSSSPAQGPGSPWTSCLPLQWSPLWPRRSPPHSGDSSWHY